MLPGTALKGLAVAAAQHLEQGLSDLDTTLFGSPRPRQPPPARRGSVVIWDALPAQSPKLVAVHDSSLTPGAAGTPILIDIPVRAVGGDLLRHAKELAKVARPDSDDVVGDDVSDYLLGLFVDAGRLTRAGLIMVSML